MSRSSMLDTRSHRSVRSFSEVTKVSLDAYNKVWEDILKRKAAEKKIEQEQLCLAEAQENAQRERELKAKLLISTNRDEILRQIQESKSRKSVEKIIDMHHYNESIKTMPEDLVNIFPRITETPLSIRRAKKANQQSELKSHLQEQISGKITQKAIERESAKELELEMIKKDTEAHFLENVEKVATQRELMRIYKTELVREMEFKNIQRLAEKTVDERDLERLLQAKELLSPKVEDELSPSRISESVRKMSLEGNKLKSSATSVNNRQIERANSGNDEIAVCSLNQLKPLVTEQNFKMLAEGGKVQSEKESLEENKEENIEKVPTPPQKKENTRKESPLKERVKEKERIFNQQRQMRIKMLREQIFRKQQPADFCNNGSHKATSNSPTKMRGAVWNAPLRPEEPRLYKLNAANILTNNQHSKSSQKRLYMVPDPLKQENEVIKLKRNMERTKVDIPPVVVSSRKLPEIVKESIAAPKVSLERATSVTHLNHSGNSHNFFIT